MDETKNPSEEEDEYESLVCSALDIIAGVASIAVIFAFVLFNADIFW